MNCPGGKKEKGVFVRGQRYEGEWDENKGAVGFGRTYYPCSEKVRNVGQFKDGDFYYGK